MTTSNRPVYTTMRTFPKVVNGKIVFYSEVTEYDRNHARVGEPKILEPVFSMGWSDGSDVTLDELKSFD